MDGQVYVTVEADAATPVTLEAGGSGGGSVSKGATIYWQFDGGITGQYGWDSPRKVNYVDGNIEATNAAVSKAYSRSNILDLIAIGACVIFR